MIPSCQWINHRSCLQAGGRTPPLRGDHRISIITVPVRYGRDDPFLRYLYYLVSLVIKFLSFPAKWVMKQPIINPTIAPSNMNQKGEDKILLVPKMIVDISLNLSKDINV